MNKKGIPEVNKIVDARQSQSFTIPSTDQVLRACQDLQISMTECFHLDSNSLFIHPIGSFALGQAWLADFDEASDIDILVISPIDERFLTPFVDRWRKAQSFGSWVEFHWYGHEAPLHANHHQSLSESYRRLCGKELSLDIHCDPDPRSNLQSLVYACLVNLVPPVDGTGSKVFKNSDRLNAKAIIFAAQVKLYADGTPTVLYSEIIKQTEK